MGELAEFRNGLNYTADDVGSGLKIIGVSDFQRHMVISYDQLQQVRGFDTLSSEDLLKDGDLLFVRSNGNRELIGRVLHIRNVTERIGHSGFTIRARITNSDLDAHFAALYLSSSRAKEQMHRHGGGTNISNLSQDILADVLIPVPPIAQQKAIAAVLSAWDRAIGQAAALIAAKQRLKQGLMQQLLTGRRRFPEFREQERPLTRLGEVLTKVAKSVEVDPTKSYREIGIRSHGKGIFHKAPVEGVVLGDKRVFEVVPGCLTLNIVFAWERALAVSTNNEVGMIASHRFPMFQPNPKRIAIEFVLHYMLSDVGCNVLELASPGGAGRNRTISQEQFLKTRIPLPPVDEQLKIVAFINSADGELRSLKTQLESLKKQKRGLMQQLLTGNVRVPDSLLKNGAKT